MRWLLLGLALVGPSVSSYAAERAGGPWRSYEDARFGTRLEVPAGVFGEQRPSPDGEGRMFSSADGEARLTISSFENATRQSVAGYQDELILQLYAGFEITKREHGETWLTVAGEGAGIEFYEKAVFSCSGEVISGFNLIYPLARREEFRLMAIDIGRSFQPGEKTCGAPGGESLADAANVSSAVGAATVMVAARPEEGPRAAPLADPAAGRPTTAGESHAEAEAAAVAEAPPVVNKPTLAGATVEVPARDVRAMERAHARPIVKREPVLVARAESVIPPAAPVRVGVRTKENSSVVSHAGARAGTSEMTEVARERAIAASGRAGKAGRSAGSARRQAPKARVAVERPGRKARNGSGVGAARRISSERNAIADTIARERGRNVVVVLRRAGPPYDVKVVRGYAR